MKEKKVNIIKVHIFWKLTKIYQDKNNFIKVIILIEINNKALCFIENFKKQRNNIKIKGKFS